MNSRKEQSLTRYLVLATLILLIAQFIFTGQIAVVARAFRPFIYASVFIYIFGPFANFLYRKTHWNRILCVVLTYILFFIFVGLFILMIVPSIIDSVQNLTQNITSFNEAQVIRFVQGIPFLSNYINTSSLRDFLNNIEIYVVDYSSNIIHYSSTVLSSIGSIITTIVILIFSIFMSFWALKDTKNIGEKLEDFVHAFFNENTAFHIIRISKLTDNSIRKYLIGKLYTCLILGIMVGIGITIVNIVTPLHIPYMPLIALVIGISNLIPYVGTIIGTIPCLLMALLSGFWESVVLLLIVIIVQQIDNIIITPKIIGDSVGLQPFWVIVSITAGGYLFGPLGMIISVPIVSVILYLVEERIKTYKAQLVVESKTIQPTGADPTQ